MHNSAPIQWNDSLLTGVAEIDQQHRILVEILIEARTTMVRESVGPLFERITRDLLAYAIYHFDTEEQLMQQLGYAIASPEAAEAHLTQHRSFSEQVVALRTEAYLGNADAQAALLPFLENWLVNHILTTDKSLGQFICSTQRLRPLHERE